VPQRTAPRPAARDQAATQPERPATPEPSDDTAEDEANEKVLAAAGAGERESFEDSADRTEEVVTGEADAPQPANVRNEAARALRQLDRERQMERADAATAALDSLRRREALARQAANTAPPAPRTAQQRSQIYLRIGLDEAAKQLGRPVHVIEGMSPLFMGLAQGRVSPGADATRPVVRVVYQDAQERLILLDQQRLRAGQSTSAPGGEPHWIVGQVVLHLSGEVGNDVLRNYRARVR
jgi:hypothetical protein